MEKIRQYVPTIPLNFITLGYSETGKTYFLGSLWRTRYYESPHMFSITGRDQYTTTRIQEIYDVLSGKKKDGVISTTFKMDKSELFFQEKFTNIFSINFTDVYGQAPDKGRDNITSSNNNGNAATEFKKIIETIPNQDGVFLFIKLPTTDEESEKSIEQLNVLLETIKKILRSDRKIPIALLITQIDELDEFKNIEDQIEEAIFEHKSIRRKEGDSEDKIQEGLKNVRSDTIQSYLNRILNTPYVNTLINLFEKKLKGYNIKTGVFPSTSLGFDNYVLNDSKTKISKSGLKPYGNIAAFIWMIYQFGKINPAWSENNKKYSSTKLLDELSWLYGTGQAYEDGESDRYGIPSIARGQ